MNIQVPLLFKHVVDHYNTLPAFTTTENTIITVGGALILGCECGHFNNYIVNNYRDKGFWIDISFKDKLKIWNPCTCTIERNNSLYINYL